MWGSRSTSRLKLDFNLAFNLAAILLAASLSSCSSLGYLLQAGKGQMEMINRARPIEEVIRDEKTPPRIKTLLAAIPEIKKYGESNGLKPTTNYTEFVKLDRSAASYVVSASEPLRFTAKRWSFPIVGSFPYLGWFNRESAISYAEGLKKEGWDVDVRGARAYSTLGWFRDAVLSTMIPKGPSALGELVNVVLHESVHATLYIEGQSYFNESVASFAADGMTPIYLEAMKGKESEELKAYLQEVKEGERFERRFHETYVALDALYASAGSEEEKRRKKSEILASLRQELGFKREINNATLIQYKTYNAGMDGFDALWSACGRNWQRFFGVLATLKPESFPEAQQENFAPVLPKRCPEVVPIMH